MKRNLPSQTSTILLLLTLCVSNLWSQTSQGPRAVLRLQADGLFIGVNQVGSQEPIPILGAPGQFPNVLLRQGSRQILNPQDAEVKPNSDPSSTSIEFRTWTATGIFIHEIIVLTDNKQISHLVGIENSSDSPMGIVLRLVWDVPDDEPQPLVAISSAPASDEFYLSKADLSQFSISRGQEIFLGLGTQTIPGFVNPDKLALGNIKRLQDGEALEQMNQERGFSLLPFSINNRGLAVDFPNSVILPRSRTWFNLTFTQGPPTDGTQLASILPNITQSIPLQTGSIESTPRQRKLDRINALIEILNKALVGGGLTLGEREKILEALEQQDSNQ